MNVLSGREASMFACLTDAVVDPGPTLPPVAQTDAARSFDDVLGASPAINRAGLRAALHALELAPLATGRRKRMRRLPRGERADVLHRLERNAVLAGPLDALRTVAVMSYYGDAGVQRLLGYDADAVVARAAVARAEGGRW